MRRGTRGHGDPTVTEVVLPTRSQQRQSAHTERIVPVAAAATVFSETTPTTTPRRSTSELVAPPARAHAAHGLPAPRNAHGVPGDMGILLFQRQRLRENPNGGRCAPRFFPHVLPSMALISTSSWRRGARSCAVDGAVGGAFEGSVGLCFAVSLAGRRLFLWLSRAVAAWGVGVWSCGHGSLVLWGW